MGFSDNAIQERRDKMLMMLREEPRTVRDLQAVFGGSYHTIYRDINYFLDQGAVVPCGQRASGKAFTANKEAKAGWPLVYKNKAATSSHSLKHDLNLVRRDHYITNAVRSAFVLEQLSARVIEFANDARLAQYDKKTVIDTRITAREAINALKELITRAESIVTNDECWAQSGLNRIAVIEDFPAKENIKLIEQFELPLVTDAFNAMIEYIIKERKNEAERRSGGGTTGESPRLEGNAEVRSGDHVDVPGN